MSRNQAYRLAGEIEHQALKQRIGLGETSTEVPALLERDILSPVIQALNFHPKVAFAWRANSGGFKDEHGQYVKINFTGCSDVLGMLKTGQFLACECKRMGKEPTPEQQSFLDQVNAGGGVGICVHSIAELYEKLPR
jgi:hypothetical protein